MEAQSCINARTLEESRICETLSYLVDLCLIVYKQDQNLASIKAVGQKALELREYWKSTVVSRLIAEGADFKSEI